MILIDDTHDPRRGSWVESANRPGSDFPIQNLPFGIFRAAGECRARSRRRHRRRHPGLRRMALRRNAQRLSRHSAATQRRDLRLRMEPGARSRAPHRAALSASRLHDAAPRGDRRLHRLLRLACTTPRTSARMFRPDNPLLPNYKWVPIGYHGRASSIVVSGTPVRRPSGQTRDGEARARVRAVDACSTTRWSSGMVVGRGNALGEPIPIGEARDARLRPLPRQRLVGARHPDAGSTSRSARSWRRTSPPRSRRGS